MIAIVVVFTTGPKKYAYSDGGLKDIEVGDSVLVPTESGVDLIATVVIISSARRWTSRITKAVKEV